MSEIVLKVENVGKQYRLGYVGTRSLNDDIKRWWHRARGLEDPFLKIGETNDRASRGESDYVWALQNVNFEVKKGEVLGIIGKNGAGKSTLLKLLSKVTGPTTGQIKVDGKIASLLEVGTGFHPELTGRENIFLNGAILGMTKAEIKGKFDEIVDFAGVERYIDTPVKRYSSGMYVRLAFAVAAHLEPDILIVDEVLAVGDAAFQKKAIGKMKEVRQGGNRTVLFVSHNMASIKNLCTRVLLMENGKLAHSGNTEVIISKYLSGKNKVNNQINFDQEFDYSDFILHSICLKNKGGHEENPITESEEIELTTSISFKNSSGKSYHLTFHLYNSQGDALFSFSSFQGAEQLTYGRNDLSCYFPKGFLSSGSYFLNLFIVKNKRKVALRIKDILYFTVVDGEREIGAWMGKEPGSIRPLFYWKNLVNV